MLCLSVNKKDLKPWVLKYPMTARVTTLVIIPFIVLMRVIILVAEDWGNILGLCKDQLEVSIGEWKDEG